jgi:hypothetical protein
MLFLLAAYEYIAERIPVDEAFADVERLEKSTEGQGEMYSVVL